MVEKEITLLGFAAYVAGAIQVNAAVGAVCGAAFFMMMPAIIENRFKQVVMGVLSLVGGYLAGIAAGQHGGWVAFVAASLLVTILFTILIMIQNGKVFEVITKILEIVRTIK